jgi:hypothetical protein
MKMETYEQLMALLKDGPLRFERGLELARESGDAWSEAQMKLFLTCMDGIEVVQDPAGELVIQAGRRTEQEELLDAIREVVCSLTGKPAHLTELRGRLPERFVTTEEQLRALIRNASGLELFGPGLIRLKQ